MSVGRSKGLLSHQVHVDRHDHISQESFFEFDVPVILDEDADIDSSDNENHPTDNDRNLQSSLSNRARCLGNNLMRRAVRAKTFVRQICGRAWRGCHFNTLPPWLQDNEYIRRNHRPPLPSFEVCFMSIFRLHTETVNIWTHLLGCILYVGLAIYFLLQPEEVISLRNKVVFITLFVCIIFCLAMSWVFHTVCCHSRNVDRLFSKLDYSGIVVLVMGSCISWVYFYNDFPYFAVYIILVIFFGSAVITMTLWDWLRGPHNRLLRVTIFSGFGVSAAVPAFHYMLSKGFLLAFCNDSVGWLCLSTIAYVMSAIFYVLRIPERFFPGKCDVWFQSHQIMHLLVVAAAFCHYCAVYNMAFCANVQIGELDNKNLENQLENCRN